MISPLDELRQKWTTTLHAAGGSRCRGGSSAATRRERYVDWVSGACLLVRRADAGTRPGCSTSGTSSTRRMSTSARRSARAAGGSSSHRRPRSFTFAAARARRRRPRSNAAYRRSHLAFYEKHHPRLGAGPAALSAAEAAAPAVEYASSCENRHRRPQAARLRHRHLRPQPAAAPVAPGFTRPNTCCSAAPRTAASPKSSARTSGAIAEPRAHVFGQRTAAHPAGPAARGDRSVPCAALRAAAADPVQVGRHDSRLHPPALSAVPAEPARLRLRAVVAVGRDASIEPRADGLGGVEARHPQVLPRAGARSTSSTTRSTSGSARRRRRTKSNACASATS